MITLFEVTQNNNFDKQLLEFMKPFKYGWYDKSIKKFNYDPNVDDNYWYNNCLVINHNLDKYKSGTCWDQSIYEYQQLKKFYKCQMVFIGHKNGCHTYIIYLKNNKYYWFENAWNKYRGIHGPYDNVDEIIKETTKKLEPVGKSVVNKNVNIQKLIKTKDLTPAKFYEITKNETK